MKKKYKPYNMDMKYEYKTYKNVGRDYGNHKDAYLGLLFNLKRFIRKNINKKKDSYTFCNTYSEWENHVRSVVNKNMINQEDLIHWLYRKRNFEEIELACVKTILIPIYIGFFSVVDLFSVKPGEVSAQTSFVYFLIFAIVFMGFSVKYLWEAMEKVKFYNDFIEIAETELKV